MGDSNEWTETAAAFRRHLLTHGKSADTATTYAFHLWPFWRFMEGQVHDASRNDVEAFLALQLASVSHSTAHVRLSAIKAFFRWRIGNEKDEPAQTMGLTIRKDKRQLRPPLLGSDIDRLLSFCPTEADRLLFEIDFACGLRVSELANLQVKDVFFQQGKLLIRGKGSKERWTSPGPRLMERLTLFCKGRSGLVFEMRREQIRRRMNRIAQHAEVSGFYTHRARITYATRFWRETGDLLKLQLLLGHASAETTRRYADYDATELALDTQRGIVDRLLA